MADDEAPSNHWSSWVADDPDIEFRNHVDGQYGAHRFVRKSTGQVIGWGQACYPIEHFEQSMTIEELTEWKKPPDPNLMADLVRREVERRGS